MLISFKLHLVINEFGQIINFIFTPGNEDDRSVINHLVSNLSGLNLAACFLNILFKKAMRRSPGDKGYISSDLFENLSTKGIKLITLVARFLIFDQESHTTLEGIKKTIKNKLMIIEEKILLKKRSVIESVFNII